jgi:hypothetical protein
MSQAAEGMLAKRAPGAHAAERPATERKGIAAGCRVLTLDGEIPVEFLSPGDRIVTRAGMRRLAGVRRGRYSGAAVRLAEGALGHNRPQAGLTLPEETAIHLRDWRARAFCHAAQGSLPVGRLCDGRYVTRVTVRDLAVYDLLFDAPQVIYAEGLELACGA